MNSTAQFKMLPLQSEPSRAAWSVTDKSVFLGTAAGSVAVWSGARVIVTFVDLTQEQCEIVRYLLYMRSWIKKVIYETENW